MAHSMVAARRVNIPIIPLTNWGEDDEAPLVWPPVRGPEANRTDRFIEHAAKGRSEVGHALIERGQAMSAHHSVLGHTALIAAVDYSQVSFLDLLLNRGASCNKANIMTGDTPLHRAAQSGRIDVIRRLIACGADKSARNHANQAPVQVSIEYQWPEATIVLREPPERCYPLKLVDHTPYRLAFEWLAPGDNGGAISEYEIRYRATYIARPWSSGIDPVTKKEYWFNRNTSETVWDPPGLDEESLESVGVGQDNPILHAWQVKRIDATEPRTVNITGLSPATPYFFCIRAFNPAGWGTVCSPVRVLTGDAASDAPGVPEVAHTTCTSITVHFKAPYRENGGKVYYYEVSIRHEEKEDWVVVGSGKCLTTECTAKQLPFRAAYNVRVRALNKCGWSEFSPLSAVIATNDAAGVFRVLPRSVDLRWKAPQGGAVTCYAVEVGVQCRGEPQCPFAQLGPHATTRHPRCFSRAGSRGRGATHRTQLARPPR